MNRVMNLIVSINGREFFASSKKLEEIKGLVLFLLKPVIVTALSQYSPLHIVVDKLILCPLSSHPLLSHSSAAF